MNWFIYALLSALFYTIAGILTRKLLKGNKDAWAYSFWFSFIGAIIVSPFLLSEKNFTNNPTAWTMIILMISFVVLHNYLKNKAVNFISPSIQGAVGRLRMVWIFFLDVLVLGESFSAIKLIGLFFAVSAGLLLYQNLKNTKSARGIYLELAATIIYAFIITSYSYFFKHFSVMQLTFLVLAFGAIINVIMMPDWKNRSKKIFTKDYKLIISSSVFAAFGYLFLNNALNTGEQSTIIVTTESFLVITFFAEYLYLKEKDLALKKIIAVILAIIGAILVQIT